MELTIDGLAAGGDGVGRVDGRVCFVPRSAPGDRLRVTVKQEKQKFLRGEIEEILLSGRSRCPSPCALFGECGGCTWLHVEASVQQEAKRTIVSRILRLKELPFFPSPVFLGYRTLARLHGLPGDAGSRPALGFASAGGASIVDVSDCPVLEATLSACLPALAARLKKSVRCPYEVRLLQSADGPVAVVSSERSLDERVYTEARRLAKEGLLGVYVNVEGNLSRLAGPSEIRTEGTDGVPFYVSPSSFGQANRGVNRLIGNRISEWIAPLGLRSALELFGGAANHSIVLAPYVGRYIFSELDLRACEVAKRNLALRGLGHVTVEGGEALEVYLRRAKDVDLVVLNPPRQGHRGLCENLVNGNHRAVLYVSCNPSTLARDLEPLRAVGYRLQEAAAFDMFPQTHHVETAVLMTR